MALNPDLKAKLDSAAEHYEAILASLFNHRFQL
jgi:hypothetical protein